MNKIFEQNKALIPYFTFGDPDIAYTKDLVLSAFEAGADAIELGIPFSDPLADGPVIQDSHYRALQKKPDISIKDAYKLVAEIKKKTDKPIYFMLSVNLVLSYGIEKFFQDAAKHKLAGAVMPDLAIEEAEEFMKSSKKHNIPIIFLISPLCSDQRIKKIVNAAKDFIYLISSTGTTGERTNVSTSLSGITKKIKAIKNIPVVVGFGISKKEHLKTVYKFANGAIIGSYFVRKIGENPKKAIKEISSEIKKFNG